MKELLLVAIAVVSVTMSGVTGYNHIAKESQKFHPVEVQEDTYVVDDSPLTVVVRKGDTWVIAYDNCTTISNEVIGAEVNEKNSLAIVTKGDNDTQGTILIKATGPLNTFKALIPCMDTSIKEINLNLKWD